MKLFKDLKLFKLIFPYAKAHPIPFIFSFLTMPLLTLTQAGQPLLIQKVVDNGIIPADKSSLLKYSLFFLTLVISEYFVKALQAIASNIFVQKMIHALRMDLSSHVLRQKASWHDHTLSGTLVSRATSDLDNLSEAIGTGLLSSLLDLVSLAGAMIAMWHLASPLAMMVFAMLPLCLWAVRYFSRKIKVHTDQSRKATASLSAWTQESLYGIQSLKSLNAESWAEARYNRFNTEFKRSQLRYVFHDAALFSVLEGFAAITLGIVLWKATSLSQAVTAGTLIAFVRLSSQVFDPLKALGQTMSMLQGVFTSLDRIKSILDLKQFIQGSLSFSNGELKVQDLSFRYATNQPEILRKINFELKTGQSLAIVGKTGSGKSSLTKILIRLYDNYTGSVKIAGQELSEIDPMILRKRIVTVPQDVAIFDGTIAFNISLGNPEISQEEIEKTFLKLGGIKILNKLPLGLNTALSEGGTTLSHGERQLIAFARALVVKPQIVILDEATASIDEDAEEIIQNAIAVILRDTTTIVIAHRLSTIENCQEILVLDSGMIVERGSHRELLDMKGYYYRQVMRHVEDHSTDFV